MTTHHSPTSAAARVIVIDDDDVHVSHGVNGVGRADRDERQTSPVGPSAMEASSPPIPMQSQDFLSNITQAMSVSTASSSGHTNGTVQNGALHSGQEPLLLDQYRTGWVYDSQMMLHENPVDPEHPEKPVRIHKIYQRLNEAKLLNRMKRIMIREVTRDEVMLVHDLGLWSGVQQVASLSRDFLKEQVPMLERFSSLYINQHTAFAARLACGGAIELCDAIASGHIRNGFAIVRPPGHHAEPQKSMGFCFFNNVAVATRFLQQKYTDGPKAVKKVLILDWDVHHGNGTQKAFEHDADVLYMSLHRYEGGLFYPGTTYGNYDSVGTGPGEGKSVNIPWPGTGMGDADYLYAFHHVVMPIAQEFAPDFVIISAGFDAALGDPIGETCVTPAGYGHMTHALASLCQGRLAVILEGGYNPDVVAESALAVTQVILSEPPQPLNNTVANMITARLVQQVCRIQSRYWKNIQIPEIEKYDADDDTATGTPVVAWSEMLAAYRRDVVCSKYDLFDIPLNMDPYRAFQGHVLCSEGILQDFDTLVFFIHDMGNLRYETAHSIHGAQDESLKLVDASSRVIDYVQSRKYGMIDMNIFAQFTSTHIPASTRRETRNDMLEAKATALFLWDNIVTLDSERVKNIVLVGFGSGCECVTHLLQERATRQVRAVVNVVGHGPMPSLESSVDPILKKWYFNKSKVILPADHQHALKADGAPPLKRYGRIQLSTELRIINILNHHSKDLQDFIEKKLRLANAKAAAITTTTAAPTF